MNRDLFYSLLGVNKSIGSDGDGSGLFILFVG